jgi:hypothetical protein
MGGIEENSASTEASGKPVKNGVEEVEKAIVYATDPKVKQEHWVFLEEFCYVCLKRRIYFFCQTPVPRIAAFCCLQCRVKFQSASDYYVDRHNLFMRYLQEEEAIDTKGAVDRALRRVLNNKGST